MNIELSQIVLNNGITFLAIVTGLAIGVIAFFLVKLLMDLSNLAKNVNETSAILNQELKPTLKELNETLRSVNSIVQNTDEGMGNVKNGIINALAKTKAVSGSLFSGLFKGFMTAYSLFKNKK